MRNEFWEATNSSSLAGSMWQLCTTEVATQHNYHGNNGHTNIGIHNICSIICWVQHNRRIKTNMVAMFNSYGVDFILFLFCDDESRSFASDSLATLTIGDLFVSHNWSCVVWHIQILLLLIHHPSNIYLYIIKRKYQMHSENNHNHVKVSNILQNILWSFFDICD